jgi:hypothetical protein
VSDSLTVDQHVGDRHGGQRARVVVAQLEHDRLPGPGPEALVDRLGGLLHFGGVGLVLGQVAP